MTPDTISPEQAGLRRAALMGAVAGLRSQMPMLSLARAVAQDEIQAPSGPLGIPLRSKRGRQILLLSAVGEVIGDKLPFTPSRLSKRPFLGRLGFGALSAATLAQTQGTPAVQAALRGAMGAGIGSVAGYAFRVVAGRVTGFPPLVVALAEDAIAIGLARSAIRPEALAEMAEEMESASPETATLDAQPVAGPSANGTETDETAAPAETPEHTVPA